VLTLYFSHTRGTKMDTKKSITKSKQGADFSVDLPKQPQPQLEVVESKTSAASPAEERLGAGVPTTGLQTKRLSGAQQKRLTCERKMKEGTWKDKRPPGKTSSPRTKDMAKGSGGMKRPHSDSNTPSRDAQQTKKPRNTQVQTAAYKEAVIGIKMAITHKHHPEVTLDKGQHEIIQAKLLTAVDGNPLGETPLQFLYSKFAQGVFWITCANKFSKDWLMWTVSGLEELWEGVELTVVDSKDLPRRPRVLVHIPDTSDAHTVLTKLRKQNPGLNMSDWSVISRKVSKKEQTLAFSIDPDSFNTLAKSNHKAFWGLGRITFETLKEAKKQPADESSPGEPAPQ